MLSALHFVRVVIVRRICDSEAPAESQIDAWEEVETFFEKQTKEYRLSLSNQNWKYVFCLR